MINIKIKKISGEIKNFKSSQTINPMLAESAKTTTPNISTEKVWDISAKEKTSNG